MVVLVGLLFLNFFSFLVIVINRFLIMLFIFPSSRQKHPLRRQLLLKDLFFFFLILAHKSITTTIYKFLVIFKTKTHLHMQH